MREISVRKIYGNQSVEFPIHREFRKLGVEFPFVDRDLIPADELPAMAEKLGLKFYGPGAKYSLHKDTPVVAVIHEEDDPETDCVLYGTLEEVVKFNVVGLFVKE